MSFSLQRFIQPKTITFCCALLVGGTGIGAVYQHWSSANDLKSSPLQQKQTEAVDQPDRLIVQELLTLRRSGFDPAELTIPSGNFLLAVDNLSGFAKAQLTLVEERKDKLKDIKFESRNRDWREEIDLKPGVYLLSELSHPEWVCRITVTDKVRGK
ncbi:MAG: hypothetical protein JNM09_27530 [Blastocatellia bacterium]|nr:hypothetical protein [Blastocatellia bacterium]